MTLESQDQAPPARVSFEDGILTVRLTGGPHVAAVDVEEMLAKVHELSHGKRHATLVHLGSLARVSPEARKLGAVQTDNPHLVGLALVAGSRFSQVIANFFVGIYRPHVPTRVFTSEAAARDWLRGLLS